MPAGQVERGRRGDVKGRAISQPHDYLTDFIIRLAASSATYLVLETKSFDELTEVKAAAAQRWIAAVNADGQQGVWRYAMARSVGAVTTILDALQMSGR